MSESFFTVLTNLGLAEFANASILQKQVVFSKMAVGDSNGAYYPPTKEATALRNKVWEGGISSISIDENNPNWVILEAIIPSDVGGFTIREIGVYNDNGGLLAIGKLPETYKPELAQGSSKDLLLKVILEVSNSSSVTLRNDPSVIIASKKYVDDKVAGAVGNTAQTVVKLQETVTTHTNTDATTAQKGHVKLSSSLTSASETEAATPKAVKTVNDTLTTHSETGATTAQKGHVQLSDSTTSTSTTMAATANSVKKVNDSLTEHLADTTHLSTYKFNVDENDIFTEVQYKRSDGTLVVKSVLSGGTSPKYSTRTETWYEVDGVAVKKINIYTVSYDANENVISEVLQ